MFYRLSNVYFSCLYFFSASPLLFFIFLFFITSAETYVRQGKYVEAVQSFEKEINIITGDLEQDSTSNSRNSSSFKIVTESKNDTRSENRTISIEIGKEGEKEVEKNSTVEVSLEEIDKENRKQNSFLSNPLPPTPFNSTSNSNSTSTSTSTSNSTSTSTPTSSTKRSYTEEFHKNEKKVFTTIEKNKLKLSHMRLGNIYGNHLLNLQLASYHYEKSLEYGGDMNKEMRMFFAKNAQKLEISKKEIKLGVNPGVDEVKRVNLTLSDHISNVLNNGTNKNQTRGSEKGGGKGGERVQDSPPPGDVKQSKGPKSGPAVPSRKNRWVVRSDVIEEDGALGGGPGVNAGMGDGTGGGMKMGGMGGMGRASGGEDQSEYADAEGQRQRGVGGAGGGGGAAGESSFERQVRMKEELEKAEEEERRRTGSSAGAGAGEGTASAVLSSLSNNRRGR